MQLLRSLHNLPNFAAGCVLTMGNFDGIHRGHQLLIQSTITAAQQKKLPSVLIIFEPLPREFFSPVELPARLTTLREKIILLQKFSLDYVICLRFNIKLANISADDFVKNILIKKFNINEIFVGEDFHFGYKRQGNVQVLQQYAKQQHFRVNIAADLTENATRISSSAIRQLLANADFAHAKILLGHNYFMCGRVVRGASRGKQIGFPTANVLMKRKAVPLRGVYAVRATLKNGETYNGVANLGTRPTVDGKNLFLEVHLFADGLVLYGQPICVEFLKFLRQEQTFNSLDELVQQIHQDVKVAREFFHDMV